MVNKLLNFFKDNKIEFKDKKFILAVSTGIDSVVMLDAFLKLKKIYHIELIVAHVNHQIRKESIDEEKYIVEFCGKNNIECFVERLEFSENQTNFEATARDLRYQFMFNLYDEVKADYLVLAHHANDNIETILMRIMRGSSLAGYSGMQEVNNANNRCIIRPLLNISKAEIINYQLENKLVYFEDYTNKQSDYTRNRIRIEIMPKLFNECNDLINKFNDFRKTIFEASKVVNNERDRFIASFVEKDDKVIKINRYEYLKLSEYLKQEVLFEILKEYQLSKINITQFINIISGSKNNYQNWFKEKFMFIIEYGEIIISKDKIDKKNEEVIISNPGEYFITDKKIVCAIEKLIKNDYKLNELWYNNKSLPITIRTRKNGDKIKVNGKTKKLKDLFIDLKIPARQRDELLIAEKDNEILCVFGIVKSDILKQVDETNVVIKIMEEYNGQFY